MRNLTRTNDPVLVSYITAVLKDAGIEATVLDTNMSVLEGSVGVLPRRIAVADDAYDKACEALRGADLGQWIDTDDEP
jgi:hypothetical protein